MNIPKRASRNHFMRRSCSALDSARAGFATGGRAAKRCESCPAVKGAAIEISAAKIRTVVGYRRTLIELSPDSNNHFVGVVLSKELQETFRRGCSASFYDPFRERTCPPTPRGHKCPL